MARRRITKELRDLKKNPVEFCEAAPIDADKDLFKWKATIKGPTGSYYEGGEFHLDINFPEDYPFKPMKIKFVTKIFDTMGYKETIKRVKSPFFSL